MGGADNASLSNTDGRVDTIPGGELTSLHQGGQHIVKSHGTSDDAEVCGRVVLHGLGAGRWYGAFFCFYYRKYYDLFSTKFISNLNIILFSTPSIV